MTSSAPMRARAASAGRAVAGLAVSRGCSRINWNTSRDNAAALAFYAGLGTRRWGNVVSLRVDETALARLAGEGDGDG